MLPSTGKVSYTDASISKPKSNIKNDKIQRPSRRSQKNKVKAQPRKSKYSSNKNNHVLDCNADIKNVSLSKESANVFLSCNGCLISANHDACVVKYLKDVQKHKKAKSVKQKEKIKWKQIGRIFKTEVFKFMVDEEEVTFSLDDLRTVLKLPQVTANNHAEFVEAPELGVIRSNHVVLLLAASADPDFFINHLALGFS
nr:hypothetical protein [Tanacetum cinerariifolium]